MTSPELHGAPLGRREEAVPLGVSSNLCDALSRLTGLAEDRAGGDVELRIAWTWLAPNEPANAVIIPRGLAPVIAAGGDFNPRCKRETSAGPDATVKYRSP